MKILIGAQGEGLGPASRCVRLAKALEKKGAEPILLSYGFAKEYIKMSGLPAVEVPRELTFYDRGEYNAAACLWKTKNIVFRVMRSARMQKKWIEKEKISAVICDQMYSSALAGMASNTPTFSIVRNLNISGLLPRPMNILGLLPEKIKIRLHRAATLNCIPDNPPPYQAYTPLYRELPAENAIYTGPILPKYTKRKNKGMLVSLGGSPANTPMVKWCLENAGCIDADITIIGNPHYTPKKTPENVRYLQTSPENEMEIAKAEIVVTHGGYTTIEAISQGKETLLVNTKNPEQAMVARHLEKTGMAYRGEISCIKNIGAIRNAEVRKNARRYAKHTLKEGTERTVELILDRI